MTDELARLMFPCERLSPLAGSAGETAFEALLTLLRGCLGAAPAVTLLRDPDPGWACYASGHALVLLRIGEAALWLLLKPDCLSRVAMDCHTPQAARLPRLAKVSLRRALDSTPVSLSVKAGEVEIGAGTLLTIAAGDVIALGTPADGAFEVSMPSGATLCKGLIGRKDNLLAVEIVNIK